MSQKRKKINTFHPPLKTPPSTEDHTKIHVIEQGIEKALSDLGYELIALKIQPHHHRKIQIFIDTVEAKTPLTIQNCTEASKQLSTFLDDLPEMDQLFHGHFTLEVSSPGTERPLKHIKDFQRALGKQIHLTLTTSLPSRPSVSVLEGTLSQVATQKIALQTADASSLLWIPFSDIRKAKLAPNLPFGSQKKPQVKKRKGKLS